LVNPFPGGSGVPSLFLYFLPKGDVKFLFASAGLSESNFDPLESDELLNVLSACKVKESAELEAPDKVSIGDKKVCSSVPESELSDALEDSVDESTEVEFQFVSAVAFDVDCQHRSKPQTKKNYQDSALQENLLQLPPVDMQLL
jgi:hypothetical protein